MQFGLLKIFTSFEFQNLLWSMSQFFIILFFLWLEAISSFRILSIVIFLKGIKKWMLRIALIYTFMPVKLVLPPIWITFVHSPALRQSPWLFWFQKHSHLFYTELKIQTHWKVFGKQEYSSKSDFRQLWLFIIKLRNREPYRITLRLLATRGYTEIKCKN